MSASCELQRVQISALLDGELTRDEQLSALDHLLACPACAGFYRQLRGLEAVAARVRESRAKAAGAAVETAAPAVGPAGPTAVRPEGTALAAPASAAAVPPAAAVNRAPSAAPPAAAPGGRPSAPRLWRPAPALATLAAMLALVVLAARTVTYHQPSADAGRDARAAAAEAAGGLAGGASGGADAAGGAAAEGGGEAASAIRLRAGARPMSEERFLNIAVELLQADRLHQRKMSDILRRTAPEQAEDGGAAL